jgi:hypothetical protein
MLLDLELPQYIYVDDYHEFGYYQKFLQNLNSSLKVHEINDAMEGRSYVGVIFVDNDDYEELVSKWWQDG